jgi:hypothetical protein
MGGGQGGAGFGVGFAVPSTGWCGLWHGGPEGPCGWYDDVVLHHGTTS